MGCPYRTHIITHLGPIWVLYSLLAGVDLVNDNVYTKFGLNLSIRSQDIYLFVLKILSKNQILTSIKGRNSVANFDFY